MVISGIEEFILVKTGDGGAMGRLHTIPLLRGLQTLPGVTARHLIPSEGERIIISKPTCILFIYCDPTAIPAIRAVERGPHRVITAALGADIYQYKDYMTLHDCVDFYVMPTELHSRMLSYQAYRPVYTLPECLDPIGLPTMAADDVSDVDFPIRQDRRAYWFGHSESFEKGMASLMPVIIHNRASGALKDFQVILNEAQFNNRFGLPTIPYSDRTFRDQAKQFDYAILSHFPLDLHLNSFIKSPNKAITALMAGTIPLVSDTPSYRALFERFGLERFLFGSPMALDAKLRTLDPVADSEAILRSRIVPTLRAELSEAQLLQNFLTILEHHTSVPNTFDVAPAQSITIPESRPRIVDQLRMLKLSLQDAMQRRVGRAAR